MLSLVSGLGLPGHGFETVGWGTVLRQRVALVAALDSRIRGDCQVPRDGQTADDGPWRGADSRHGRRCGV